jgi:hypothetical protein
MDSLITEHRLSEAELCRWIGKAAPSERLIYHRGFLAQDCSTASSMPASDRDELRRVARRAMLLAEAGLVHLVQRRHRADDYSYCLIVRVRPTKRLTPPTASASGQLDK